MSGNCYCQQTFSRHAFPTWCPACARRMRSIYDEPPLVASNRAALSALACLIAGAVVLCVVVASLFVKGIN